MVRCVRCCLHNSIKLVNMIILVFGIGIIIYSLWLERQWHHRISKLPVSPSPNPKPWFIFICLAIGIAVSLSTLYGYVVANYVGPYTLYIFIICCLLLLEAGVIIIIFFKMNWISELIACVDELHKEFAKFVVFHVKLTRTIVLLIWAAQINAVALAVVFWAIGIEPRTHCNERHRSPFTQSFLVPDSPEPDSSTQAFRGRGDVSEEDNSRGSLFSYIDGIMRARFQRRNDTS
eukprot:XP_025012681.1 tetraspanin-19-like [Ricinus communis]